MQQANISGHDLNTWADYLLDYSLGGVQPDDVIMIKGEYITWPLMSTLQDKIFAAGGIADVNIIAPDNDRGKVWGASIARHGTVAQIQRVPAWHEQRYLAMTKYIEILGAEDPALSAGLPEETAMAVMRADEAFKRIRLDKPWVLTLYPTQGFADLEGMTLDEYTDVIVAASTKDPRELDRVEEDIHRVMSEGKIIRIQTRHPQDGRTLELRMNIDDHNVIKCTGERNFPDGEVFTSPDANSVEGEIFVDLPVYNSGTTIQGIYLTFTGGRITDYRAEIGQDTLKKIIETDEGSHRLGEVAFGMNAGITSVLKHPLFVEKVGGTLHIAIGSSYGECYVDDETSEEGKAALDRLAEEGRFNRSAQHVDIVTEFRGDGAGVGVWIDDTRLGVMDGIWVVS
ncbi:MAG: aminopeptidase [Bacteroidetes bacterium]|nr:aminopeptidase [Bacteroidota bacterium]